ncbi:MAG: NUDIX domain-containing protein [Actinobacteria bacterium]|nr:NUDIX domain-containing protein [Actinomycetota bacterium]
MSISDASSEIPCVGAVVFDDAGRLLLIKRGQEPALGRWSVPGGRVEPGESHEVAVIREVLEETGLDMAVIREIGTVRRASPGGGTYVIHDFLGELVEAKAPVGGDDATDAGFFTLEQLCELNTSDGLLEALVDWGLLPPLTFGRY